VPKDVVFATKAPPGRRAVQEAEDGGVPFGWIAADGGNGQYREVRQWATDTYPKYVMAVASSQPLARVHAMADSGSGSGRAAQAAAARAVTC
jgi:methyl coenzyme M reductase alpha subunit